MSEPGPQPTNAELEILSVLWELGSGTVREVQDALGDDPPRGYTTVLKLMQIMADKGLLAREAAGRAHVYTPLVSREGTRTRLIDDLAERAFGGSAVRLALHALSADAAPADEIREVREWLERIDGTRGRDGEAEE